jgi:hypothetical protein
MDLTLPPEDTIWQTGLKRKIQKSDVYRRPISLTETSTALGWKAGRRLTKKMAPKTGRSSNTYLRQSRLPLIKQEKEGQSILIKGEIHQKEITIINLYAPNVSAPNFIKYTLKDLRHI